MYFIIVLKFVTNLSWVMGFFHWFLLRSVLVHDKKMRMSKDKVQLQSIVEEVITLARQSSGEVGSHSLSPGAILKVWRICFVGEKSVLRWMDGFTETGCFVCVFFWGEKGGKARRQKKWRHWFVCWKKSSGWGTCFSFRSWFWWECSLDVLHWNNRISDPEAGETSRREV